MKEMEGTSVKQMYFKLSQTALTFQPVTLQHSRCRELSTFEDLRDRDRFQGSGSRRR